jgi:hypothetical protein
MVNTDNSRAAARAALAAYRSTYTELGGFYGNGDRTDTQDLIVDLGHLADTFADEDEVDGQFLITSALDTYIDELPEEESSPSQLVAVSDVAVDDGTCR